jgi:pilin isopeptide linkage protein
LKKAIIFLLTGAVTLVTLCLLPFTAFAAEAESVSIPVEIEGGGTAEIISEVNCPLPESSSVEVKDGATENINISFTTPGDYEYTVKAEAKDGLYYSPEYYTAAVAVRTDSSGELAATVVLTKADSDYKPAKCRFELSEKPTEAPKTESAAPEQAPKEPPTSRPKTGDDGMLDIYLLICIVAAGGLFMLAVIYSVSTERLIKRK